MTDARPLPADGHLLRDGFGWKLNWHARTVRASLVVRVNTSREFASGSTARHDSPTHRRRGRGADGRRGSTLRPGIAWRRSVFEDDFLTAGGDGRLWLEGVAADDLVRRFGSPLYVVSETALRRELPRDPRGLRGALAGAGRRALRDQVEQQPRDPPRAGERGRRQRLLRPGGALRDAARRRRSRSRRAERLQQVGGRAREGRRARTARQHRRRGRDRPASTAWRGRAARGCG